MRLWLSGCASVSESRPHRGSDKKPRDIVVLKTLRLKPTNAKKTKTNAGQCLQLNFKHFYSVTKNQDHCIKSWAILLTSQKQISYSRVTDACCRPTSVQRTNNFSSRDRELWPVTLTFELDLHRVTMNQDDKYLGQKAFSLFSADTDTYRTDCCAKLVGNYGRPLYFHAVVSIHLLLSIFFSSPNLSGRRLDVYHTSTHGVALV